ncbi:hypothetical protein PVL29_008005 [Vitis rotundifolia]|uniref:Uncharacterized protein n=1 Tax=Vitis rotundifolia TaxID=103349 RepID=A0AA39DVI3_VITRO|nr:hypothetical protein PVL29_008005 [Vitis rotundifolia]
MGLSIAKKWLICLALISMILFMHVHGEVEIDKYLHPCEGPYPPAGCRENPKTPPEEAHKWKRGCSPVTRCRGGDSQDLGTPAKPA